MLGAGRSPATAEQRNRLGCCLGKKSHGKGMGIKATGGSVLPSAASLSCTPVCTAEAASKKMLFLGQWEAGHIATFPPLFIVY